MRMESNFDDQAKSAISGFRVRIVSYGAVNREI